MKVPSAAQPWADARLIKSEADNLRLREALERIATLPKPDSVLAQGIASRALASKQASS